MTTISGLMSTANAKKCRFEYHTRIERVEYPGFNPDGSFSIKAEYRPDKTYFGLEYKPWIWAWFWVLEDGTALCEEVYSMRTGRSDKSFRRRFVVENLLSK